MMIITRAQSYSLLLSLYALAVILIQENVFQILIYMASVPRGTCFMAWYVKYAMP